PTRNSAALLRRGLPKRARASWRRGWDSNPRTPVKMLLEFQSSAFDRSAISPTAARMIHHATRDQASGSLGLAMAYLGGVSRHPCDSRRAGGSGVLRLGMRNAPRVSGDSRPGGIF